MGAVVAEWPGRNSRTEYTSFRDRTAISLSSAIQEIQLRRYISAEVWEGLPFAVDKEKCEMEWKLNHIK